MVIRYGKLWALALAFAGLGLGTAGQREVEIELRAPATEAVGLAAVVQARTIDGGQELLLEWPAKLGTAVQARLDAARRWEVRAEAAGFWVEPQLLPPPPAARIALTPRATAQVRLSLAAPPGPARASPAQPGARQPEAAWIRFRDTPGVETLDSGREFSPPIPCQEVKERQWECSPVAGKVDLRVEVAGSSPLYFWRQTLAAGQTADLGRHRLRAGGSVVGWVEQVPGLTNLEIHLSPVAVGAANPAAHSQRPPLSVRRAVGRGGFFQVDGLAPDLYALEVLWDGLRVGTTDAVEVRGGEESRVGTLIRLSPPATVELAISPPTAASGAAWQFVLFREAEKEGAVLEQVVEGQAAADGTCAVDRLEVGRYTIRITQGEARWLTQSFEVGPGWPTSIFLDIPRVEIEGRITLGQEPLEAGLLFGGKGGGERLRLASDEKGHFAGFLPRPGRWRVEIEPSMQELELRLRALEVPRRKDGRATRLAIHLPDTYLAGRVVDQYGLKASRAQVTVWAREVQGRRVLAASTADDEGEFLFRGLPEGSHMAEAIARDGAASPSTLVELSEDRRPAELLLVLEDRVSLSGVVHSPSGPVAGATVVMWPQAGRSIRGSRVFTDETGHYSLQVLRGAVNILISAPGNPVRILATRVGAEQKRGELNFNLPEPSGRIAIEVPPAVASQPLQASPTLSHAGGTVGLIDLLQNTRVQEEGGHRMLLPAMEPGRYQFCQNLGQGCDEQLLVPGGEIQFRLERREE